MKTLKNIFIASIATGFVLVAGCKKLTINKDFDGGTIVFQINPQSAGSYDEVSNVKFNLQSELDKLGIKMDRIKSLHLKKATFIINDTTPSPVTFDIVDNASLELSTATKPFKKIAWKDPMPHTGLTAVDADVDGSIDIVEYAKEDNVIYHLKGALNTALTHPVEIKAQLSWNVEAGL